MKKYVKAFLILSSCLLAVPTTVFAASGSYSTYYDMTGGVYSQRTWNATKAPVFEVSNSNAISNFPGPIDVYLQEKKLLGYSGVDHGSLPARGGGSCSVNGPEAGTYRLYFHQDVHCQRIGNLDISWRW